MRLVRLILVLGIAGGSAGGTVPRFDPAISVNSSTIDSGSGSLDWVARASIKRRADDVLVMVYYKSTHHALNAGALRIRFSDDNGATWTAEDTKLGGGAVTGFPMNPTVSAGQDAGEPWLYLAPNGDLLVHMWRLDYGVSTGGTYQSRSTDGGETWSTPSGPIQFAGLTEAQNGRTFATDDDFVFDGVIYAGARVYNSADFNPSSSVLITSDDNGVSWTRLSTIWSSSVDNGGQEVGLEYLGNSTIIAMLRDNNHTTSRRRFSYDMGATWDTLDDITSQVGIAARQRVYTRSHLLGLPGWWNDPVLIMCGFVHQSSGSSTPRRNAVWFSPDRGVTWDGPHYVDDSTEDAGYGDIFWNGSGYSFVSYHGAQAAASLKQYDFTVVLTP